MLLSCEEWVMKYPTCVRAGKPAISLAAGGYQAGFQNLGAVAGRSQTRRFEVWPDLTAAIRGGSPDLQAVALGEGRCFGSFNLGGECGQGDHGGSEQRQGRESEEGFEHFGGC